MCRCIPTVEEAVSKAVQCGFESRHRHPGPSYAYVLGLYLGDGCISRAARTYRLRIALDRSYPLIIGEAADNVQKLVPRNRVGRTHRRGDVEVWAYSNTWIDLFPQHGPGKKHDRPIVLRQWQAGIVEKNPFPFLRGLVHSDGSRDLNRVNGKEYPRYSFSNRSGDIRGLFCGTCDLVGVHWAMASGGRAINVARRADVALLDRFIGPKA